MTASVTGCSTCSARVDLHEREGLGRRLVEELDRAGAAVAGAQRQAPRRVQDLALLLGRERRARRLLDDLLVAALVRAVAQADRPRAAAAVGDDLHLDVARGRHELLEQHGAVAEGLLGLGLRAGERGRKRLGLVDAADAAPAAPRRRLDHDREADARGVAERLVDGLDGTAAPRRHRHAGFFGEPLGGDPVANQTHDRRVGPDEDDAEPLAQLGELGLLRDEAPPDPDRIGARLAQGALQRLVVEVAAVERDRLVGVADEHRVALGLRVERDDAYRLGAVDVELAHGVDDAHGGLAAVDDRKAGERALHRSAAHRRADRRERVRRARVGATRLATRPPRGDAFADTSKASTSSPVGTVALTVREPLSRMVFTARSRLPADRSSAPSRACRAENYASRVELLAGRVVNAWPVVHRGGPPIGCGSSRMRRAPIRT